MTDGHAPNAASDDAGRAHAEHFEREDDRWRDSSGRRDWVILAVMIAIYLVWTGVVYLLEPGIR